MIPILNHTHTHIKLSITYKSNGNNGMLQQYVHPNLLHSSLALHIIKL